MDSLWDFPDFDGHELVHFVTDRESGLNAVICVHSTHLGPGAGREAGRPRQRPRVAGLPGLACWI